MRSHRLSDLAAWTDGRVEGDPTTVVGPDVVIDSRLATTGCLFVALPGEHVDGHDFTARAADAGAAAVLASRPTGAPVPHLLVDDPLAGLSGLARAVVDEARAAGLVTLAITGSSGKTSTKDLLAQVLEAEGPTVAPVGSFNNEIGVPLTATGIDEQTRFLVSEMGARGQGHIAWLCSMTPPLVSMVLNVGSAHLGEFGSVEGIARAKGEIVEALPAEGWAVLNADDRRVAAMASRTIGQLAWFSAADARPEVDGPLVWATRISLDDLQRPTFTLVFTDAAGEHRHQVSLALLGRHMVANAAAAAAAAWRAGVAPERIAASLTAARHRSHWRMQLEVAAHGGAVINDSYNANPDSMKAALAALGAIGAARRAAHPDATVIAVLGDMLELGPDSTTRHHEVGRWAAEAGVDLLLAIGDEAPAMVAGAAEAGLAGRVVSVDEAGSLDLGPHDVVLVKASRGLALERVAAAVLAHVVEEKS
ncbi:UDP-N-acetylmuramoyl-tripeptide--D-alanyl-D-alanine ligase [Aestuariimicrobium kwangyangense]|uniref:UDP-N-acetylmuramoyl-tripeptide--D-alanyl-D- alanine ligase n=1 Tax=Aestuariimicrobium kwangyangense TaxID=396389 RepID=UPI0003B5A5AE|nr:UDP-N-acetylmuramoyl-tripeptide--D-alanyl-D-alanine ligase [Aestuariimicrobium kwangyangense]